MTFEFSKLFGNSFANSLKEYIHGLKKPVSSTMKEHKTTIVSAHFLDLRTACWWHEEWFFPQWKPSLWKSWHEFCSQYIATIYLIFCGRNRNCKNHSRKTMNASCDMEWGSRGNVAQFIFVFHGACILHNESFGLRTLCWWEEKAYFRAAIFWWRDNIWRNNSFLAKFVKSVLQLVFSC